MTEEQKQKIKLADLMIQAKVLTDDIKQKQTELNAINSELIKVYEYLQK